MLSLAPLFKLPRKPNLQNPFKASASRNFASGLCRLGIIALLAVTVSSCQTEKPKSWVIYCDEGNKLVSQGDVKGAEESFQSALALAEKQYGHHAAPVATILGYLGQIYRSQGEWKLAYVTYKRLLPLKQKLDPNNKEELKMLKEDYDLILSKMKHYGIPTDDEPAVKKDDKKSKPQKKTVRKKVQSKKRKSTSSQR